MAVYLQFSNVLDSLGSVCYELGLCSRRRTVEIPSRLAVSTRSRWPSSLLQGHKQRLLAFTYTAYYKGYVKKVFPSLHIYACAVSQLPRCLLGRFLFLQYLAAVN
jgi:hypothetical protein